MSSSLTGLTKIKYPSADGYLILSKQLLSFCYTNLMNWWVLKRKIHISWLIAIGCIAIFIGVFLAQYFRDFLFSSIVSLAIAIIFIGISFWRKYIYLIPFLIIGGVMFGLWRGGISQDELVKFKPLYGKSISIEGSVKDDVDIGSNSHSIR